MIVILSEKNKTSCRTIKLICSFINLKVPLIFTIGTKPSTLDLISADQKFNRNPLRNRKQSSTYLMAGSFRKTRIDESYYKRN